MKKHIIKLLGISAFIALALGSASTKEQQQTYISNLQAKCASFGFKYGTEGMANCVSQQYAADTVADQAYQANRNAQAQHGLDLLSGRCQLGQSCR